MELREKVSLAVAHCLRSNDCSICEACPYNEGTDYGCRARLRDDIIELLKAQEPRVIKVGDVRNWVNSDRVTREPIVFEIRGGVCVWIVDDEVSGLPGEADLSSDLYGKTWRCWTSRPTDAQREAVKWE